MGTEEVNLESHIIPETDNMGRERFWEDLGRPENDGLALKIFQNQCCSNCFCTSETESKKNSEIDNAGREKFWEDIGRP